MSDETFLSRLAANLVSAANAASLGTADEGAAFVRSLLPGYQDYNSELTAIRSGMDEYQNIHPYQSAISSLIGSAVSAATPAFIESAPFSFGSGMLKNASLNGASGFVNGFADSEDGLANRSSEAVKEGIKSALLSTAIAGAAHKMKSPNLASLLSDERGSIKVPITPDEKMLELYKLGQSHAGQSIKDLIYSDQLGEDVIFDKVSEAFWKAGYKGKEIPKWVEGYRYGPIPPRGYSFNYRDNSPESGVSLAHLADEKVASDPISLIFLRDGRKKIKVAGWLLDETGSDGEPLIVGAKALEE